MSDDDHLRYRAFTPDEEPRPSRQQLLLQALQAIARSKAAQERAAEAKEEAQRAINRPVNRGPDVFAGAATRYYGRLELERQLLAQIDREEILRAAARRKERDRQQVLKRAREALGEERWRGVEAAWAARKRKQQR